MPQLGIEDEDSASLDSKRMLKRAQSTPEKSQDQLDVAVIRLPRLSNFTDFDPLQEEKDVHFRYITHLSDWGDPDVVLLPGSKNTMDDLRHLNESGLAARIQAFAQSENGWVAGICAGYQMLGVRLLDPQGYESDHPELEGIGLLPTETVFTPDKRTVQVEGSSSLLQMTTTGCLILMGMKSIWGGHDFWKMLSCPFKLERIPMMRPWL